MPKGHVFPQRKFYLGFGFRVQLIMLSIVYIIFYSLMLNFYQQMMTICPKYYTFLVVFKSAFRRNLLLGLI